MIWISVSLLGLTGWQGYRLGREYGWWGNSPAQTARQDTRPTTPLDAASSASAGLGRSRTDVNRLLVGYEPAPDLTTGRTETSGPALAESNAESDNEAPITEPATTLSGMVGAGPGEDFPDETDRVPDTCNWLDDEAVSLVDGDDDEREPEELIELGQYVQRVRTVQRKLTELTNRRQADTTFVRQELGMLIQTYQLDNDQSLAWLFEAQAATTGTDYGSLFDRIETGRS